MLKVTVQQAVAENGIECPHSKEEGKRVCVFLKPGSAGIAFQPGLDRIDQPGKQP